MRTPRTVAVLLSAVTLLGLSAPAAAGRSGEPARITPEEAAPGQTVTVSVVCERSTERSIVAHSEAFDSGTAALTVAPDGRSFTGTARLASRDHFAADGPRKADRKSRWGVDGSCPNGDSFVGKLAIGLGDAQERSRSGLGGSVTTGGGELATGGVLVAAGIAGFWLLRRRVGRQARG